MRELQVAIGGRPLLEAVNLQLGCGEVMSVIGPNGAGKTTLLRAIAGEFSQHQASVRGSIEFAGRNLSSWTLASRALQLAVLPQSNLLNFPFLVCEVIELGRVPHSSGHRVDQQVVNTVAGLMDVEHLLQRVYTQLSGGEKQRVQLARVFAQLWSDEPALPRLLLLDEPLQALDYGHQRQVMQAIRGLAQQGVAVLQVMHDVNLAAQFSQRMLALVAGRMHESGSVEQIMQSQTLQQIFGVELHVVRHPQDGHPVLL
ncbi:MAG: heme ABC transporter ATP-binding protein [Pseudomonadales bacterium]|nr:heme ABC transporter ATP-binding protein [Pseudomonadales bacterium]